MNTKIQKLLLTLAFLGLTTVVYSQSSAFTYQGVLTDQAGRANGLYDFRFNLFAASSGGGVLTTLLSADDVSVTNGLFTVALDFGAGAFDGSARWLEIAVRPGASTGSYTNLTPRQPLNATPYAVRAANFSGTIADTQLSGNVPRLNAAATFTGSVSFSNATGTFSGNGAGLRNIDLPANSGGAISPLGGFALVSSTPVGAAPVSMVTLDVNGDGKPDLITANNGTNTLTVVTNDGRGGFAFAFTLLVGNTPYSVAGADLNNDGKLDLISANLADNTLTVLTNNAHGSFGFAATIATVTPVSVAAADVNGDGKVDLIAANAYTNRLTVLTNNGVGGFVMAALLDVGTLPAGVTAADVNGDGKIDLISANYGTNTLTVLTNNGRGVFVLASLVIVDDGPFSVTAADVNGDGKVDLISANFNSATLSVLTNNGVGRFVLASTLPAGLDAYSVAAADVNGDGKLDLITPNSRSDTLSVFTNNGAGGFLLASSPAVPGGPIAVITLDVNADGKVDLISGNFVANTVSVLLSTPTFNGSFNGTFIGSGLGLSLNASNLIGSIPSDSLTSIPAYNLVGSVPSGNLLSIPAENLYGSVPASTLTTLPAENLVGSVPSSTLTVVPASSLFGTIFDLNLSPNIPRLDANDIVTGLYSFNPPSVFSPFTVNSTVQVNNLNAERVGGLRANQFWQLGGNAGTTPGTQFIGTTDNQPLELKVNGSRVLRLEPGAAGGPNVVGGSPLNFVAPGVVGATIGGGGAVSYGGFAYSNSVTGDFGSVGGGAQNKTGGQYATVGGGYGNSSAYAATVGGGYQNSSSAGYTTVGGGIANTSSGPYATVGGGVANIASGNFATLGGGYYNQAAGIGSFIGGGGSDGSTDYPNVASGGGSVIGGGIANTTAGLDSTVGGGRDNHATNAYAAIPGGAFNTAGGQFSFAAGLQAKALHNGAFVWSDSIGGDFISTAANQFLIRASGGVGIGTTRPEAKLHLYSADNPTVFRIQSTGTPGFGRIEFVSNPQGDPFQWRPGYIQSLDTGGFTGGLGFYVNGTGSGNTFGNVEVMRIVNGNVAIGNTVASNRFVVVNAYCNGTTWVNASDRNLKENFAPVDRRAVLEKVARLPITQWTYKADPAATHLGPVAQDFKAAFALGSDDKAIATVDADGVALAAIQGLNQKLEEALKTKDAELKSLQERFSRLEALVQRNIQKFE
jgi:hypothetical protein